MNPTSTQRPRKKALATALQNGKSLGAASGSFRVGDFTMRLPIDWADTEGQIAGV